MSPRSAQRLSDQMGAAHYSTEKGRESAARRRKTPKGEERYQRTLKKLTTLESEKLSVMTPEEREAYIAERRRKNRVHMAERRKPHCYTRALDLTGQRFGRLTAVERTDKRLKTSYLWRCQCDCGRSCTVSASLLTGGQVKSCGCLQDESRRTDITGEKRGHLTAIKPTNHRRGNDTI